jgi:hypothetical protein
VVETKTKVVEEKQDVALKTELIYLGERKPVTVKDLRGKVRYIISMARKMGHKKIYTSQVISQLNRIPRYGMKYTNNQVMWAKIVDDEVKRFLLSLDGNTNNNT